MFLKLKAADGSYVSAPIEMAAATTTRTPGARVELVLDLERRPRSGQRGTLQGVDWRPSPRSSGVQVSTFDPSNRRTDALWWKPRGALSTPERNLELHRLNHDGAELDDGDRIALRCLDAPRPGWISAESGSLRVVPGDAPAPRQIFTVEVTTELNLFWQEATRDHVTVATSLSEAERRHAGATFVRSQGRVYLNDALGRTQLQLFWHEGLKDYLLTAADEGVRAARAAGYQLVRAEGWLRNRSGPDNLPLRNYRGQSPRPDHFATTTAEEERQAAASGYRFVREEGYVLKPVPAPAQAPLAGAAVSAAVAAAASGGLRIPLSVTQPAQQWLETPIRFSERRNRRGSNKKALVLAGGGAKGCFEVGAVKRLWEQGYRPDIICGVSVGALNAAKLAEGTAECAAELEALWRNLRPTSVGGRGERAVYLKNYFLDLLAAWSVDTIVDGLDNGSGPIVNWLKYVAAHFHALHLMAPLRDWIRQSLNPDAIRRSGMQLRVGVTDLKSGQYFSVTEPLAAGGAVLQRCGRIDPEPDHRLGETWLTRPIFGSDAYAMSLEDAIYASCTLPVFMDPKVLNLRDSTPVSVGDERFTLLKRPFVVVRPPGDTSPAPADPVASTYSAAGVDYLLRVTRNGTRTIDANLFAEMKQGLIQYDLQAAYARSDDPERGDAHSAHRQLFDGGLRDTMAIRTAIRLGAREITVISGDRLQSAPWDFKNPGTIGSDLFALPVAQYLFGLLGIWFNEAARTDMLLAVAQNEFLGWLYRCYSLLDEPKRRQLATEFNQYWAKCGPVLRETLGGATWIGGDTIQAYGTPFLDEGCCIRYVTPSRDVVNALDFHDWAGIEQGIDLGYEAAANPTELSFPVPNALVQR